MTLLHRLWIAWGPDGWTSDPAAIIAAEPMINNLSAAIDLAEYAHGKAQRYGVPAWRAPWFGEVIGLLDEAFCARVGGPIEWPAEVV